MSPILIALALGLGNPAAQPLVPALVAVDTVRVIEYRHGDRDLIESVFLKPGIVKQGIGLRL
jgi:hypothetical protein